MERKVEVLNTWEEQGLPDEVFCEARLYEDNHAKADVITSYSGNYLRSVMKKQDQPLKQVEIINALENTLLEDFNAYLNLPKISECSPLLQEIYDNVCEADSSMCHIDEHDWEKFYADRYNEKDIETLKDEIKRYGLNNIITVEEDEYKIVGYGDLECSFNDDRHLTKEKDYEL